MGYGTWATISVGIKVELEDLRPFLGELDLKEDIEMNAIPKAIALFLRDKGIDLKVEIERSLDHDEDDDPWDGRVALMCKRDCLEADIWGFGAEGQDFAQCDLSELQPSEDEIAHLTKIQDLLGIKQAPQVMLVMKRG